jgi:glutamate/tyrosine decarboxylase-like PLP-dependent enzyme
VNAFSYHPAYYAFDEHVLNYFELGLQNSRGFRALKVWLALKQVGRAAYLAMIADDMRLARRLFDGASAHEELQAVTQALSITTFRYVPPDLRARLGAAEVDRYLDDLNRALLAAIERSGEAFVSSAVVGTTFVLRACIVNFHTSAQDVDALVALAARLGRITDAELRPTAAAHLRRSQQ